MRRIENDREASQRLVVDVHVRPGEGSTLADDVRKGLGRKPKSLPPKHFYDERGSKLFDQICDTPEYYQTRTEQALLEQIAEPLVSQVHPTGLVELGSGAARKTRCLLEAAKSSCCYVPFDVSEEMLRSSASALQRDYPWLKIHGVVGDYDRHLDRIPELGRRLFVFLGGTIGNFEDDEARRFLGRIASIMGAEDRLLMGTDLVKDRAELDAAYNDDQGLTAEFNKNVLRVINRELDADFELDRFEHVAFFREERSRIEMHLRSVGAQKVRVKRIGLEVSFEDGETIHTEISRKFTRSSVERLYASSNLEMESWHVPANDAFALSVARRVV
ncbi:L-histidine N(alpha)-methyltransferase [Vulgatibacter incomptus]|uniref:Dimethylhistidine N-methyltransferase n=1 Tax=Vulgatibacter incomptus TaxID=1391653 RepID=A0A0K1PI85_9BACT|nr:L-histidine N(alpha)-methyltransferase [Vulgatibacter incomptus]AKU93248.1 Dimethylhistidine N-methyltransferase [Vulgatibacter incomptus]